MLGFVALMAKCLEFMFDSNVNKIICGSRNVGNVIMEIVFAMTCQASEKFVHFYIKIKFQTEADMFICMFNSQSIYIIKIYTNLQK